MMDELHSMHCVESRGTLHGIQGSSKVSSAAMSQLLTINVIDCIVQRT